MDDKVKEGPKALNEDDDRIIWGAEGMAPEINRTPNEKGQRR
jgi:hypothetical protein